MKLAILATCATCSLVASYCAYRLRQAGAPIGPFLPYILAMSILIAALTLIGPPFAP